LIITEHELLTRDKHRIADDIFEVNLDKDTQFSFITINSEKWESKLWSFYPIYKNIKREGIQV